MLRGALSVVMAASQQQLHACGGLAQLRAHSADCRSVHWSPCGSLLLTASFDGTAAALRVSGGVMDVAASYRRHTDKVLRAVWCNDSVAFVTASADRTVVVWEPERRDLRWTQSMRQ